MRYKDIFSSKKNGPSHIKKNEQHLLENTPEQEDIIEEMEEYIEKEGKFCLSEERLSGYYPMKEKHEQSWDRLDNGRKRRYLKTLKDYKSTIIDTKNQLSVRKLNEDLVEVIQQMKEIESGSDSVNQSVKILKEKLQQYNALENRQNTVLLLSSVLAAVLITALICYAIFSHPSYILDNAAAK